MYLILARCSMDDIPLAWTESEKEAVELLDDPLTCSKENVARVCSTVFKMNPTEVLSYNVIRFLAGRPDSTPYKKDVQ